MHSEAKIYNRVIFFFIYKLNLLKKIYQSEPFYIASTLKIKQLELNSIQSTTLCVCRSLLQPSDFNFNSKNWLMINNIYLINNL